MFQILVRWYGPYSNQITFRVWGSLPKFIVSISAVKLKEIHIHMGGIEKA